MQGQLHGYLYKVAPVLINCFEEFAFRAKQISEPL